MNVIRKELLRIHPHFNSLRLLKRKTIRRKVLIRYPNFSKRMVKSTREIRIAKTLFQRGMEKLEVILASSFLKKVWINRAREKVPNNSEPAKAINPAWGFCNLPIPIWRDSIRI